MTSSAGVLSLRFTAPAVFGLRQAFWLTPEYITTSFAGCQELFCFFEISRFIPLVEAMLLWYYLMDISKYHLKYMLIVWKGGAHERLNHLEETECRPVYH